MVLAELVATRAIAKALDPPSSSRTEPEGDDPSDLEAQAEDSDDEQVDLGPHASSVSGTSASSVQVKKDVFLNFEVLRGYQHKIGQWLWVFNLCGAITCYALTQWNLESTRAANQQIGRERVIKEKTLDAMRHLLQQQFLTKLYLSVAIYCLVLCLPMSVWCIHRLVKTRDFQWTRRQRYLVSVSFLKLAVQTVNVIFMFLPNAYIINHCRYFGPFIDVCAYIRWTCWNLIFFLTAVHARNCSPALKKQGKHKDRVPRIGDPKIKYDGNDVMILDVGFFQQHKWLMAFCCVAQASIIYLAASGGIRFVKTELYAQPPPSFCPERALPVVEDLRSRVVFWVFAIWLTLYVFMTSVFSRWSSLALRMQSYTVYQYANLLMLWVRRQSIWMDVLAIADASLLYNGGTTIMYLYRWTGQPALQLIVTATTTLDAFYMLPMEPSNEEHVYNAWLQQFVWTKRQVNPRMRAILKQSPTMGGVLGSHPIFCMETAIKLLVWSTVVYEDATLEEGMPQLTGHSRVAMDSERVQQMQEDSNGDIKVKINQDVGDSAKSLDQNGEHLESQPIEEDENEHASILGSRPDMASIQRMANAAKASDDPPQEGDSSSQADDAELSTEQYLCMAMNMYHLTDMKIIHGPVTDTKAIIAWNHNTVVLAFRGTNSMTNVRHDAKAWRTFHEPRRGSYWLGTAALVHKGFQQAWQEIRERVMSELAALLKIVQVPNHMLQIYLTGHSLGGGLAVLAAWDIQQKYRFPELTCYTYGAPRPGNKVLADEFSSLVPNLYHVINDRDSVPRAGKFGIMYKRPGQRVLINPRGDIRVRPTIFEINLHTRGFTISQHLLKAYLDSLVAICVAQFFKTKSMKGGLRGVERLSKSSEMCCLMKSCGIDLQRCLENSEIDLAQALKSTKLKKKCVQNKLNVLMRELLVYPLDFD